MKLPLLLASFLLTTAPAHAGQWMQVTDPPSNVRATPNGRIICSIPDRRSVYVTNYYNGWYYSTITGCSYGSPGYIHNSQLAPVSPRFSGYCILRGQSVPDHLCY